MAILDSLGTAPQNGASSQGGTLTNYDVVSSSGGKKEIRFKDTHDAYGALVSRLIFGRYPIITMDLIAKTAATPTTDFPMGDMCAIVGLTTYYVEDCEIATDEGETHVRVTLKNLGIT